MTLEARLPPEVELMSLRAALAAAEREIEVLERELAVTVEELADALDVVDALSNAVVASRARRRSRLLAEDLAGRWT